MNIFRSIFAYYWIIMYIMVYQMQMQRIAYHFSLIYNFSNIGLINCKSIIDIKFPKKEKKIFFLCNLHFFEEKKKAFYAFMQFIRFFFLLLKFIFYWNLLHFRKKKMQLKFSLKIRNRLNYQKLIIFLILKLKFNDFFFAVLNKNQSTTGYYRMLHKGTGYVWVQSQFCIVPMLRASVSHCIVAITEVFR